LVGAGGESCRLTFNGEEIEKSRSLTFNPAFVNLTGKAGLLPAKNGKGDPSLHTCPETASFICLISKNFPRLTRVLPFWVPGRG